MDSINDILASLSPEDIQALKETAQSIFSDTSNEPSQPDFSKMFNSGKSSADSFPFNADIGSMFNTDLLSKLPAIMSLMNSDSSKRCRLIEALKPNLSIGRQKKADEAMQIIRIMELLPLISNLTNRGE
jgi:hypothetical protein